MTDQIDPAREPEAAAEFDRQMRKETYSMREQNDNFRTDQALVSERIARDQLVITRGVAAHGNPFIDRVLQAVREFSDFTPDNDPWGEHDFGAFALDGVKLFWKIDLYEETLVNGSARDTGMRHSASFPWSDGRTRSQFDHSRHSPRTPHSARAR